MLFKDKRELIAEVKRLKSENQLLLDSKKSNALTMISQDDCNKSLANRLKDAGKLKDKAHKELSEAKAEINKLKKMVREQSEADLLINALKAVGMIKDSGGTNYQQEAARLQAQSAAAHLRASSERGIVTTGLGSGMVHAI